MILVQDVPVIQVLVQMYALFVCQHMELSGHHCFQNTSSPYRLSTLSKVGRRGLITGSSQDPDGPVTCTIRTWLAKVHLHSLLGKLLPLPELLLRLGGGAFQKRLSILGPPAMAGRLAASCGVGFLAHVGGLSLAFHLAWSLACELQDSLVYWLRFQRL